MGRIWKEEPEGRRELSSEEFEAYKRADRERLELPARELAARAKVAHRTDTDEAMSLLTESFHVLRGAPGLRPWDAEKLYHHALSAAATSAGEHAVRFVLDVWNKSMIDSLDEEHAAPPLGHFCSVDAMASWDAGNRAAYATWVADPWWP